MSKPPYSPSPYTPPTTQHIHHHYHAEKSSSTAILLEVIPGLFGIFGIGHIYLGRIGVGIAFLVGFWVVSTINIMLSFIFIGFITGPLCYIAALIVSPIMAANYCKTLATASPPVEQATVQSRYGQ